MSMIAVAEMRSFEELAKIRMSWKLLWEKSRDASFAQSWEWMRSYCHLFGQDIDLRTLIVTLNAKPIGIVPFVQRPVQTKLGVANVLTWPLEDWGLSYGAIGPNPAATLTAAMRHIRNSRDWNAIELSGVDESGTDRGRTRNALQNCGITPIESDACQHPMINLDGSWDWYLEEQGPDSRMNLTRAEREVSQHGPVTFHRWRPIGGRIGETERRWDLFHTCEELHRGKSSSSARTETELAFLKDLHPVAVDAGAVDICTMTVNGRPVACSYGHIHNGILDVQFVQAIDPIGAPATELLIGNLVRDSFMRGDRRITFRRDYAKAAASWINGSLKTVTLSHVPKLSPRGQLLKFGRRSERSLAPAATTDAQGLRAFSGT